MPFDIEFTAQAVRHFKALDARLKTNIRDGIEAHLRHEPTKTSKSRIKRLREMNHPQYRLRLGDHRVFYDLDGDVVLILAILPKPRVEAWLNEYGIF